MEQVCRLSVVRPCKPQIHREIILHLKIVPEINECVLLAEVERRVALGDLDTVWNVLCETGPVREAVGTVKVRQEYIRRPLISKVDTSLQAVAPEEPAPIVLHLIGIHNSPLRGVCSRTHRKQ